jgi:hypothetical protein
LVKSQKEEEIVNIENLKKTLLMIKKQYLKNQFRELKKNIGNLSDNEMQKFNEITMELKNIKL